MTLTNDKSQRGVYEKYEVTRTDGTSGFGRKHYGCSYFVLDTHCDPHAVAALRAYAASCESTFPQLASDLLDQADKLETRIGIIKNLRKIPPDGGR